VIAVLLLSLSPAADQEALPDAQRYAQLAETAYRAGLVAQANATKARPFFREAAQAYDQLWRLGRHNPEVARNMAQAYLLAGDLARAIRAYHRGLHSAPHDRTLRDGLAFAQAQVQYPAAGTLDSARPRERPSILHYASADTFGLGAASLYLLGCLALARAWMMRRPGWWIAGGALIFLAVVAGGFTWWEERRLAEENSQRLAIIATGGTVLHRGNSAEFPPRLPERLPEGVEASVLAERGGWLQVQLAGGEIGWVSRERVVELGD
jgi:hypothetical protein